jgi:quercetin dioxygenase-like cupin family protein
MGLNGKHPEPSGGSPSSRRGCLESRTKKTLAESTLLVTQTAVGGMSMSEGSFIKNIPFSEPQALTGLIDYQEGRVVSRTFAQNRHMNLTLFAFEQGEGLSTHTAAGDAFVYILDGEATVTIGGKTVHVSTGEVVVMPANVPHSLQADTRFKMLLVVVKGED